MSSTLEVNSLEKYYSVKELALEWGVSTDIIRRRFAREPGVVVICNSQPGKRPYRTLRIPQSIAERVRNKSLSPQSWSL